MAKRTRRNENHSKKFVLMKSFYSHRHSSIILELDNSSYDRGHEYLSFIESMSFPVTVKVLVSPVPGKATSRMLARYIADRRSEIRYSRGMGELSRERIRMQIRDLEEMAHRTADNRSALIDAYVSYKVSSDHPVKLRESGLTFSSLMGMIGFKVRSIRYITRKVLMKISSPLVSEGNAYLMDTHSVSSITPIAFTGVPSTRGIAVGVDDITEKPVFLDLFGKSSHNVLIFGETGSGKSFFSKIVLMRYNLIEETDEIIIVDPLDEYSCEMFNGNCSEVTLAQGSNTFGTLSGTGSSSEGSGKKKVVIYKTGSAMEERDGGLLESLLYSIYHRMEKSEPKKRIILIDEAHLVLYNRDTQELLSRLVRHSRHYSTSVICVTQNMDDLSKSRLSSVIAENSATLILFRSKSVSRTESQRFGLAGFDDVSTEDLMGGKTSPYSECYIMEENSLSKVRVISTQMEVDVISE